jgi:hypothetical protein
MDCSSDSSFWVRVPSGVPEVVSAMAYLLTSQPRSFLQDKRIDFLQIGCWPGVVDNAISDIHVNK